jgi:hypothetical protein
MWKTVINCMLALVGSSLMFSAQMLAQAESADQWKEFMDRWKNTVVLRVNNQNITWKDLSGFCGDADLGPSRKCAEALVGIIALAQQGQRDHLDQSAEFQRNMERHRLEVLGIMELGKRQKVGSLNSNVDAVRAVTTKAKVWMNEDYFSDPCIDWLSWETNSYDSDQLYMLRSWVQSGEEPVLAPEKSSAWKKMIASPERGQGCGLPFETRTFNTTPVTTDLQGSKVDLQAHSPQASPEQSPQQVIDNIRDGPHEAMPPAQATANIQGSETNLMITNDTAYSLSIYLSGPVTRTAQIAAHGSQSISVTPGKYEVAAKVADPSVIPFYGVANYDPSTQYSEDFYIGTHPR